MAIDLAVLERLVAEGASGAVVLAAVRVQLEPSKQALRQRRYWAKRQASVRERQMSVTPDAPPEQNQEVAPFGLARAPTRDLPSFLPSLLPSLPSTVVPFTGKEPRERARVARPVPADGWSFDAFYGRYPNHVGKQAAIKAFERVRKSHKVEWAELMAGLDRYVHKADDRPWCNPATWLNQGRWEDQPAQVQNGRAGPVLAALKEKLIEEFGDTSGYVPQLGPQASGMVEEPCFTGIRSIPKG